MTSLFLQLDRYRLFSLSSAQFHATTLPRLLIAYAENECVTKNVIRRNRLKITSFSEFKQSRLVLFILLTGFLHTFVELVVRKRYVLPRFIIGRETLQNWFNSPCVTICCPVCECRIHFTTVLSIAVSSVATCTCCGLVSSSVANA